MASGVMIWFIGYQRQAEVDSSSKMIAETLREAQARTISGKDFKRWGVYFDDVSNKFILFAEKAEGEGFATAEVKEENYLPSTARIGNISLGGGNEIIFNKPAGSAAQYGTVRVVDAGNANNFRDIIVTQLGKIDRQ